MSLLESIRPLPTPPQKPTAETPPPPDPAALAAEAQRQLLNLLVEGQQSLAEQMGRLAQAVSALQLDPVIQVAPAAAPGPTMIADEGVAVLASTMRQSMEPMAVVLGQTMESLKDQVTTLRDDVLKPRPITMHGGTLSKVSLIDFNGNPLGGDPKYPNGIPVDVVAGNITIGTANQGNPGSSPWPVTAGQGAPTTVDQAWPTQITDGVNVLGTGAHPVVVSGSVSTTGVTATEILSASNASLTAGISATSTPSSNAFLLSRLEMKFSTTDSKTITVTTSAGTVLVNDTNTAQSFTWDFNAAAFAPNETVTLAVTAVAGATVTYKVVAQTSATPIAGNPTLAAGTAHVGSVSIDAAVNNGSSDAFGKLRVSNPFTLLDSSFQYDLDSMFWDSTVVTGGAVASNQNLSGASLTVTSAANASIKFQTHNYLRYQPGKAMQLLATGVLGPATAHQAAKVGFFDDNDGVFFQVAGTGYSKNGYSTAGYSVVRRTSTSGSPVDNGTPQASWNLDTLTGAGGTANPSGLTLDLTKMQIFVIDFQWLSTGVVRWGFEINGKVVYCHVEYHANLLTVPYMKTANLPVRYSLDNDATGGNSGSLLAVCSTVVSEGGQQPSGRPITANSGTTASAVSTAGVLVPVFSIRPALTFAGIVNRGLAEIVQVNTSNVQQIVLYTIVRNPTLTGPVWTTVTSNSMMESDTTATAMTGGVPLTSFYAGGNTGAAHAEQIDLGKLRLSLNAAGTVGDIYTLAASKVSANDSGIYGAMTWTEYH